MRREELYEHFREELKENKIAKFELDEKTTIAITRLRNFLIIINKEYYYIVNLITKDRVYTVVFLLNCDNKSVKMLFDELTAEMYLSDEEFEQLKTKLDNMFHNKKEVFRTLFELALNFNFISYDLYEMLYIIKKIN